VLPESTINLIVTGIVAVLSTLFGIIVGAWLERRSHMKETRERLFKALYQEIKLNHFLANMTRAKSGRLGFAVFEIPRFHTEAYQRIRTAGELTILSRDTLSLLEETYEMIYAHNRQMKMIIDGLMKDGVMRDQGLKERINVLENNLWQLIEKLPQELSFLSSEDSLSAPEQKKEN